MKITLILILLVGYAYSATANELLIPEGIQDSAAYKNYKKYLKEKKQKAFAISKKGAWSWGSKHQTLQQAKQTSIKNCTKQNNGECYIIDENGKLLVELKHYEGFLAKSSNDMQFFPSSIENTSLAKRYKNEYLRKPGHKAFAAGESGASGWITGKISIEIAKKIALDTCNKNNKGNLSPCRLIDINGKISYGKTKFSNMTLARNTSYPEINASILKVLGQKGYKKYKAYKGHKAYAIITDGRGYYSYQKTSAEHAKKSALEACKKYYKQECSLFLLDNNFLKSKPTKPWHAKYAFDFSKHENELKSMNKNKELKNTILQNFSPSFIFSESNVQMLMGSKIIDTGTYTLTGKNVTMKFKQQNKAKEVQATFSSDYSSITLKDGERPTYHREK